VDLVFSNAALQWLGDHRRLLPRLFSAVADGGAFGFQIPSNGYAGIRKRIHEIAEAPMWRDRMTAARAALTMEEPSVYYDILAGQATAVDIWQTEYFHRLESSDAIVDWMQAPGYVLFSKHWMTITNGKGLCGCCAPGSPLTIGLTLTARSCFPFSAPS